MKRPFGVLFLALLATAPAWGGKVRTWHHFAPAHYERAQFKGLVLAADGSLALARQVRPLAQPDAAHVWAVAEDSTGNLFAATGNDGKLFKLSPDGQLTTAYQADDGQLLSIAVSPAGGVYVGTGPKGHVLKVSANGEVSRFCETGENYVWSLVVDPTTGDLFAGTGPRGRVLRIGADGRCQIFYTTKQDHVLCLALGRDGQLYAGTSRQGLVYRIDRQGKGSVLFDAPQAEVRTLLADESGVIAGTAVPSGRKTPAATLGRTERADAQSAGLTPASFPGPPAAETVAEEREKPAATSASSGTLTAPMTGLPPSGTRENSVYRIAPDGTVRELFREKVMVLGLLPLGDRLLVATGGDGQVFEVSHADRSRLELVRLDHSQVHCLVRRKDGSIVIGTGDPGRLYVIEDRRVPRGTLVSEVLDAKGPSRWGEISWSADLPAGTTVSVATRSGNSSEPDETWSPWSTELTGPAGVVSPAGRFLQYRLTLATVRAEHSPLVRRVTVRYQPVNAAPEVGPIELPDTDTPPAEGARKLKVRWAAADPNGDDLTYALSYRKEGWPSWVHLETDWDKREYELDPAAAPSGTYRFRVVASDRRDNPEGQALTGERVSAPFVIDHDAPTVEVKCVGWEGDRAVFEATAADGLSRLHAAACSLDGQKWANVFPTDGLFDSRSKRFRWKSESLGAGVHVLVLRVTDAAGNVGSADVVFERPSPAPGG